jgi:hypothetical protein
MTAHPNRARTIGALLVVSLVAELLLAPAASASHGHSAVPVALFGIPSLHSIIQAIANGFFGALAGALVPSWLKHGTVATIQHLVALPDPAAWPHVGRLQGETTYLGAMLLPVTLAVGALRYWLVGLTGAAHPATALTRSVAVTGVLVAYRWIIEQTVAGTNTFTHGILELPAVGNGLQRIIGVLFGGALLTGTGGVFGALLVIVGVVFAAGLFAAQVLLTVLLAVLIVAGPPLIAISAIPELSHLARSWSYALLAVALVPLGWTVLFATAGALCLDATSFTGASGGLPGHVAAAFAGLITFVIAARLPLLAAGQIRHIFASNGGAGQGTGQTSGPVPGGERVRSAHARLRAVGLEGIPSLGRSVGRAAGALGAPQGGAAGVARRGLASAARRSGIASGLGAGAVAGAAATGGASRSGQRRGARGRLADARSILASAPRDAWSAVVVRSRGSARVRAASAAKDTRTHAGRPATTGAVPAAARATSRPGSRKSGASASSATAPRSRPTRTDRGVTAVETRPVSRPAAGLHPSRQEGPAAKTAGGAPAAPSSPPRPPEMHPAGKQPGNTRPAARTSARPTGPSTDGQSKGAAKAEHPRTASPRSPTAPRTGPPAQPRAGKAPPGARRRS